jgi:CheY-like chemotaxis protein
MFLAALTDDGHKTMAQILIADDDVSSCQIFGELLRMLGHKPVCVHDGKAALARIQTAAPDLLILDIMMPEMDGWQVLQSLKDNSATAAIPVVMYSCVADPDSLRRATELGAKDFWVKASFDFRQTQSRITQVLSASTPRALSA